MTSRTNPMKREYRYNRRFPSGSKNPFCRIRRQIRSFKQYLIYLQSPSPHHTTSNRQKMVGCSSQASMSLLIQNATALNRTGVQLVMSEQNYDGAITVFSESIRNLKQQLIFASERAVDDDEQPAHRARPSANIDFCELGNSDEDDIPFNRAITITYRDDRHVVREQDLQLFSAAVIFNIALVHHHQVVYGSSRKNRSAHAMQRKAEKLYDTVITLLASSNSLECPSLVRAAVLIQLACFNNLAQLRFRSGLDESARSCLEMASRLLSLAKDEIVDDIVFEDSLVQGLFLRAFLLRTIPQMAAAA